MDSVPTSPPSQPWSADSAPAAAAPADSGGVAWPDVPADADVPALWRHVARTTARGLHEAGLALRDAVLLVPFAALLEPARRAWAEQGGWMPRIETVSTLAASLGPPAPVALGHDGVLDRLQARALLRSQPWAVDGGRKVGAPLAHLAGLLADAAGELAVSARQLPPPLRTTAWAKARQLIGETPPAGAPGALEAVLRRVALEWAAAEVPAEREPLFDFRPSAWVVVILGGEDPGASRLVQTGSAPVFSIRADPPDAHPFSTLQPTRRPARWLCADEEEEAWLAAEQVMDAVNSGRTPVALVTLDRAVARRVRAHLDRAGVPVADETGWRLSASAAASRVMALLQAAEAPAGAARQDALLSWLKCTHEGASFPTPAGLLALESQWRGLKTRLAPDVQAAAQACEREALRTLAPLQTPGPAPLAVWLQRLAQADGDGGPQGDDPAVRRALRWDDDDPAWRDLAAGITLTLAEFRDWVDQALEAAVLEPDRPSAACVVFTPLARAVGRPFAQVVVPGADDRQLAGPNRPLGLWNEAHRSALGLQDREVSLRRQRQALAQLLRHPAVSLLRRREDLQGPCGPSPWVLWLAAEAQSAGVALPPEADWQRPVQPQSPQPVLPPLPTAPQHLPLALSASRVEALRNCPYQFFVRVALGLKDPEELDDAADKRDYGTWLHAALEIFHARGLDDPESTFEDGVQRLRVAADEATRQLGLEPAALLSYAASAETFWPDYLRWWRGRQATGWRFEAGEWSVSADCPPLAPSRLTGQIDRVDVHRDGRVAVIDFKTGSSDGLKRKLKDPLEDTQLVFYAAMLRAQRPQAGPIEALYLALDEPKAPVEVPHPDVEADVEQVLAGLSDDLAALRAGAPWPALGQAVVCERCEARGLCRRDHWAEPAQPVGGPAPEAG
jgi:ATP-dependent helicase/nuclease subunit B